MAKLINVIKDKHGELDKRHLPLVIDDKLTMVVDLVDVDFMCEYPKLQGKERELFLKKFSALTMAECKKAFEIGRKRLLDIVSALVSCVGCRRSVERLFLQTKTGPGQSALYPLVVTIDGTLVLPDEAYNWPSVIGAMFQNHTTKLKSLSTSWNRSKKNSRCSLHCLEAQRFVRPPLGNGLKTIWDCMADPCKKEVATIEISQLFSTLESYLQKHRFCTECRTKVMKAYSLLIDEPDERKRDGKNSKITTCPSLCEHDHGDDASGDDPCSTGSVGSVGVKEKGFVPKLYAGIRRCSPKKDHIHVDQKTEYIMGLIQAAEPELLGNGRREKHAKTLEIAQEEVLVCVGLCLYERVHRIQLRLREEQATCQILALVAINALSINFELAVEMKQGVSQIELLFQEFTRVDKVKQRRKEVRKLKKRRRKEERKHAAVVAHSSGNIGDSTGPKDNDSEDEDEDSSDDSDDECLFDKNQKENLEKSRCSMDSFPDSQIMKMNRDIFLKEKYTTQVQDESCWCSKYENTGGCPPSTSKERSRKKSPAVEKPLQVPDAIAKRNASIPLNLCGSTTTTTAKKTPLIAEKLKASQRIDVGSRPTNDFSDTCSNSSSSATLYSKLNKDNPSPSCKANDDDNNNNGNVGKNSSKLNDKDNPSHSCEDNNNGNVGKNSSSATLYSKFNDKVERSHICQANDDDNNNGNVGKKERTENSSYAMVELPCDCCTTVHNDCGYGSADNNTISSSSGSSVDSNSELACSEGFCNHECSEDCNLDLRDGVGETGRLTETSFSDCDQKNYTLIILLHEQETFQVYSIPKEAIRKYKSSMASINEQREALRRMLRERFEQFCSSK